MYSQVKGDAFSDFDNRRALIFYGLGVVGKTTVIRIIKDVMTKEVN
jgi:replication-associated recombination protein RarA